MSRLGVARRRQLGINVGAVVISNLLTNPSFEQPIFPDVSVAAGGWALRPHDPNNPNEVPFATLDRTTAWSSDGTHSLEAITPIPGDPSGGLVIDYEKLGFNAQHLYIPFCAPVSAGSFISLAITGSNLFPATITSGGNTYTRRASNGIAVYDCVVSTPIAVGDLIDINLGAINQIAFFRATAAVFTNVGAFVETNAFILFGNGDSASSVNLSGHLNVGDLVIGWGTGDYPLQNSPYVTPTTQNWTNTLLNWGSEEAPMALSWQQVTSNSNFYLDWQLLSEQGTIPTKTLVAYRTTGSVTAPTGTAPPSPPSLPAVPVSLIIAGFMYFESNQPAASITLPVLHPVAAGSLLIIYFAVPSTGGGASDSEPYLGDPVTDSQGNTYTFSYADTSYFNQSYAIATFVVTSYLTNALTTSDTVTVNQLAGSQSAVDGAAIMGVAFSGATNLVPTRANIVYTADPYSLNPTSVLPNSGAVTIRDVPGDSLVLGWAMANYAGRIRDPGPLIGPDPAGWTSFATNFRDDYSVVAGAWQQLGASTSDVTWTPRLYRSGMVSGSGAATFHAGMTLLLAFGYINTYEDLILSKNPNSYWTLGQSSGSLKDLGWNGYDYIGANASVSGPSNIGGQATTFDGTINVHGTDSQLINDHVFAAETWFRTTSAGGGFNMAIIAFEALSTSTSDGFAGTVWFSINSSGKIVFNLKFGTFNSLIGPVVNDGNWHHVAFTTQNQCYLDGSLIGSATGQFSPADHVVRIGNTGLDAYIPFVGDIAHVAVYAGHSEGNLDEGNLTPADIVAHASWTNPGSAPTVNALTGPSAQPISQLVASPYVIDASISGSYLASNGYPCAPLLQDVPAGSCLILLISTATPALTAITDSQGNTYTIDHKPAGGTGLAIAHSILTNPLSAGSDYICFTVLGSRVIGMVFDNVTGFDTVSAEVDLSSQPGSTVLSPNFSPTAGRLVIGLATWQNHVSYGDDYTNWNFVADDYSYGGFAPTSIAWRVAPGGSLAWNTYSTNSTATASGILASFTTSGSPTTATPNVTGRPRAFPPALYSVAAIDPATYPAQDGRFPATGSTPYILQMDSKSIRLGAGSRVSIDWYDSGGSIIQTNNASPTFSDGTEVDSMKVQVLSPANAASAVPYVAVQELGAVRVDNALFITTVFLTNPGDQVSHDGDVISLQLTYQAPPSDTLVWQATGLPASLSIDSSGKITGTVTDSPATFPVNITVTDTATNHQVSTSFNWLIPAPVAPLSNVLVFADNPGNIWIMNGDGSNRTMTIPVAAQGWSSVCDVTDSGTKLLAVGWDTNTSADLLMIMDQQGGTQVNITNAPAPYNATYRWRDATMNFSPDGTQFSMPLPGTGIAIVNADNSGYTTLAVPEVNWDYNLCALWSPDGTKFAYSALHNGNYTVGICNSDGSGQTVIFPDDANYTYDPYAWYGDSTNLLVIRTANSGGAMQLWMTDGTTTSVIYDDPTEAVIGGYAMALSPDNLTVAFGSDGSDWMDGIVSATPGAAGNVITLIGSVSGSYDYSPLAWAKP